MKFITRIRAELSRSKPIYAEFEQSHKIRLFIILFIFVNVAIHQFVLICVLFDLYKLYHVKCLFICCKVFVIYICFEWYFYQSYLYTLSIRLILIAHWGKWIFVCVACYSMKLELCVKNNLKHQTISLQNIKHELLKLKSPESKCHRAE